MPSTVSVPLQAEDQDLSGFDGGAPQDGSIKAAWGAAGAGAAGAAPLPGGVLTEKKRSLVSATFRLPRRGSAVDPQQQQEQQQQGGKGAQLLRAATLPSMALGGATAGSTPSRRPAGASLLLIPGGGSADAATPTMVGQRQRGGGGDGQQAQQGQAVAAAAGQPPEEWSPVDLQEASWLHGQGAQQTEGCCCALENPIQHQSQHRRLACPRECLHANSLGCCATSQPAGGEDDLRQRRGADTQADSAGHCEALHAQW